MNAKLAELIETQKHESFTDPSQASDMEALGILIAKHVSWNGQEIVQAFLSALEDANFHSFHEVVTAAWKAEDAEEPIRAFVSGTDLTISRAGIDVLGVDFENGTIGHWPDGETWEHIAELPGGSHGGD
jgi:hypothetical protein